MHVFFKQICIFVPVHKLCKWWTLLNGYSVFPLCLLTNNVHLSCVLVLDTLDIVLDIMCLHLIHVIT